MQPPQKIILVTMGDPAGIGPEIIVKSLATGRLSSLQSLLIIGSAAVLRETCKQLNIHLNISPVQDFCLDYTAPRTIHVYDMDNVDIAAWQPGKISEEYGHASYEYIEQAVKFSSLHPIGGMVTAPIHKRSLRLSGIEEPGHTEILQKLCAVDKVETMFMVDRMRVFFYSRHLPLCNAVTLLDKDEILQRLSSIAGHLRFLGIESPRIAVAALNPHASDGGLFGTEERNILAPAVAQAQAQQIGAYGPIPADSVFHQALNGKYHAVLSLYHDQGHIACKTYDFYRTISVTLGLPFIRTSVDHGTAFDIAGTGSANSVSMAEAILQCVRIIHHREKSCTDKYFKSNPSEQG